MCEILVSNSDSNTSTDSWTVLSRSPSECDSLAQITIETAQSEESSGDATKGTKSEGFLTFDAYLRETVLEHDCEASRNTKIKKLKDFYKGKCTAGLRKCKAANVGIAVIFAIILTLSAFATIVSTSMQPEIPEIDIREEDFAPAYLKDIQKTPDFTLDLRDVGKSLQPEKTITTKEFMEKYLLREESKKPEIPEDTKAKTPIILPDEKCDNETIAGPEIPKPRHQEARSFKELPAARQILRHLRKMQKTSPQQPKTLTSNWALLKEILHNTNLHAVLSLVMTNIYLFTLMMDLTRRYENEDYQQARKELEDQLLQEISEGNAAEITRVLFRELPFAGMKNFGQKKGKKLLKLKAKSKLSSATFTSDSYPVVPFKTVKPVATAQILPVLALEESGKSECEKRFAQLDLCQKKYEDLQQSQRDRVKLLKQKYKNEVSLIRDTEEEEDVRAEKINQTSQKFMRKMKFNREKYLLEVRKVREQKQCALEHQPKKTTKNALVGSYQVALSPIYDFARNIKVSCQKIEQPDY